MATELTLDDLDALAADRGAGWAALREAGRLVRIGDIHYVSHRDDVEYVLRHHELFSSKQAFDSLGSPMPMLPIAYDPPEHTRYRKILQPFFGPRPLAAMLPALQGQIADLVDPIAARGHCEVNAELAVPYPSQVFLSLFGLPLADRDRLIGWKSAVIAMSGQAAALEGADLTPALELFGYLSEHIQAKRADPADDVLSHLLTGEDALDDTEALGLGFLFVLAGLDTVTATIGFALHALARDPALRHQLGQEPDRLAAFVEEVVRLEPAAPFLPRVTTRDVELAGETLPAGTLVHVCVGAANRDPHENPGPDQVDLHRAVPRHWGFGGGAHRCLGMHLARLELTLVLNTWHARIPEYEVTPGTRPRIQWPANTFSLESLELSFPADVR